MLEARYSIKRSLFFLIPGLATVLANTVFYFRGPMYYPALWAAGVVLSILGIRGLDRRVRLRVSPEGLFYATWFSAPVPWHEFERFGAFKYNRYLFVEVLPKFPHQFRGRLSLFLQFGAWINQKAGRPALFINPVQLDTSTHEVLSAIRENGGPTA